MYVFFHVNVAECYSKWKSYNVFKICLWLYVQVTFHTVLILLDSIWNQKSIKIYKVSLYEKMCFFYTNNVLSFYVTILETKNPCTMSEMSLKESEWVIFGDWTIISNKIFRKIFFTKKALQRILKEKIFF